MKVSMTPYQILLMTLGSIISTGHILFVSMVISHTQQDGWISLLIASVILLLQTLLIFSLGLKFPNQSIVTYATTIAGRWIGKLLSGLLLLYMWIIMVIAVSLVGEIIQLTLLPDTPAYFISLWHVLLSYWVVRQGGEVVARSVEVLLPFLILLGMVATITLAPNRHLENMLPILDLHLSELTFGALLLAGLFAETILYSILVKYSISLKQSRAFGFLGVLILLISFIGPITGPVAIFGPEVASSQVLPTYSELTYANISEYFERLNPIGIILWSSGAYIKISVFFFAVKEGLIELINRPEWNKQIMLLLAIMLMLTQVFGFTLHDTMLFWEKGFWGISLLVGLGIPGFLWLVLKMKALTR